MDSILAPTSDGTFQWVFGHSTDGLFLHRLDKERFLFRHSGSGLSLFYFSGSFLQARELQKQIAARYNFCRDSTWVLKGQSEIHALLLDLGLSRRWL